jgi:hypothetical protein
VKSVSPSQQTWLFSADGKLQGLRTGADCYIEHEGGHGFILDRVCPDHHQSDAYDRYRATRMDRRLCLFEDETMVALLFSRFDFDQSIHSRLAQSLMADKFDAAWPYVAWDGVSFVIAARVGKEDAHAHGLKDLYQAFSEGGVLMDGAFGPELSGGGIGFYIESRLPSKMLRRAKTEAQQHKGGELIHG